MPAAQALYFLPRLLKFARTRAELSQRQLADRVGLGQPCVVGWESGMRATSEETLAKVARALGHKSVEDFLCDVIVAWMNSKER